MNKEKKKKKLYVCKVCGKEKHSQEGEVCCGKDMLEKKQVWRD